MVGLADVVSRCRLNGYVADLKFLPGADGLALAELLQTESEIPLLAQVKWIEEAATALSYCHGAGVVHRNLTPDSIYVTEDGRIRIGGFALAKAPSLGATISVTGQPLVRSRYTAPEQLADAHDVDARADIYALGVIWCDLVAGRSGSARLDDISLGALPIPDKVRCVLRRMVAPRRVDRYPSCDLLLADLNCLEEFCR